MTLPSGEEDSQTDKQLNGKSAKAVADHVPLLALLVEASSGKSGLLARAKERNMNDVWGTSLEIDGITSKG